MIKQKIENLLKKIVRGDVKIEVFASEREEFGHYSSNVALKLVTLARNNTDLNLELRGKNPMEIAREIESRIRKLESGILGKIEAVPPGFINFWLSEKTLQDELKNILRQKNNYGKAIFRQTRNKNVQLEFVSANPTGPLTLANGRGGYMGDVLGNILEFCGYKVEREYYVNDTGNQILILGKSILAALKIISDDDNFYKGDYIKKWAKKNLATIEKYKNDPLKIGKLAAKDFLKNIKKVLKEEAKIKYNRWTSEDKDIHKKNYISKVLEIFEENELVYEKDNASWLKTTQFGDDKDRVLVTSDNFPTYFLADSGHFLETKERGFKNKIMILGPDHHGYVKRIKIAAEIIGLRNFHVIITQAVRLISAGKEVKMSKRKGEFVTFEDLIKEVKPDAARFFFLMHSADSHMDFDLDLAKEQSMKNPVYYVQYASVRCQSILRKSEIRNPKFETNSKFQNTKYKINLKLLNTKEDLNLMRMLARFPEIVKEAAGNYSPSILARYVIDLSRTFHNFYEKERIIADIRGLNAEQRGHELKIMFARLELVKATQIVFKNLFKLLGIRMPKKM